MWGNLFRLKYLQLILGFIAYLKRFIKKFNNQKLYNLFRDFLLKISFSTLCSNSPRISRLSIWSTEQSFLQSVIILFARTKFGRWRQLWQTWNNWGQFVYVKVEKNLWGNRYSQPFFNLITRIQMTHSRFSCEDSWI